MRVGEAGGGGRTGLGTGRESLQGTPGSMLEGKGRNLKPLHDGQPGHRSDAVSPQRPGELDVVVREVRSWSNNW